MRPTISWEIRGRRLVDGALVDQHVATGFGVDAASAIRWARHNEPAKMASFPDCDLRAIPDPFCSGRYPLPETPVAIRTETLPATVAGCIQYTQRGAAEPEQNPLTP